MSAEKPGGNYREKRVVLEKAPVLDHWYDAYKDANIHHPQDVYGIHVLVGREIVHSLKDGVVDLRYVAQSKLTHDQIDDVTDATVRAHRAHGVTKMPEGHAAEGHEEFSPNIWFNDIWRDTKRSVLRAFTYVAADMHPHDMEYDQIVASKTNELAYDLGFSDADPGRRLYRDVERFSETEEYATILPVIVDFYDAAAGALNTEMAKFIARRRRDHIGRRKDEGPLRVDYQRVFARLMKDNIDREAEKHDIPEEKVSQFLNASPGIGYWVARELMPLADFVKYCPELEGLSDRE